PLTCRNDRGPGGVVPSGLRPLVPCVPLAPVAIPGAEAPRMQPALTASLAAATMTVPLRGVAAGDGRRRQPTGGVFIFALLDGWRSRPDRRPGSDAAPRAAAATRVGAGSRSRASTARCWRRSTPAAPASTPGR